MKLRIALGLFLLFALGLLASQTQFAYRRFYVYPRTQAALDALERSRGTTVPRADGLTDFRGVMHSHSYLSHDSMGTVDEIIAAGQRAKVDFIFMTDHYGWQTDARVISQGLRGEHGGVLFVVGSEMRDGVMPFFLDQPPARYNPHEKLQDFVDDLRTSGAVVFLNHPDDPKRRWDLKNWTGMEIYNLHADASKSHLTMYWRLSEQLWSIERFPLLVFHQLFHEPREYLRLWDTFTRTRRVVGIAGNDAHQNNGLRLIVTKDGNLALTDTGPFTHAPFLGGYGWFSKTLARLWWGQLTPGRTLWRMDADLYERSFRFVNTHLLASAKTEADLRHALEQGHAYVAFDSLVTATGFDFAAKDVSGQERGVMGDELQFGPALVLQVLSPVPATLRLIRGGRLIRQEYGTRLAFPVDAPGGYRAEVHLHVRGQLWPWIYSNPIYIR